MSAPRRAWLRTASSGLTRIRAPSYGDTKVAPSSSTAATATAVERTRRDGGRVVSVGTTTLRVLETCATPAGTVTPASGVTRLFVRPGHEFQAVDALLTNFHQPRSSLLVLLAAFIGQAAWRNAYAHALRSGYRFLSFGDCMLCWRAW